MPVQLRSSSVEARKTSGSPRSLQELLRPAVLVRGLLGFVGGKLASALKIGDIDTILATGMAQQTTKGFAKQPRCRWNIRRFVRGTTQSIQEQMWQNFAEGKPITEGVGNAAAQGLAAGAVMVVSAVDTTAS